MADEEDKPLDLDKMSELEKRDALLQARFGDGVVKILAQKVLDRSQKRISRSYDTKGIIRNALALRESGIFEKALLDTVDELMSVRSTAAERELQKVWKFGVDSLPELTGQDVSAEAIIKALTQNYRNNLATMEAMNANVERLKRQVVLQKRYGSMKKSWRIRTIRPVLLTGSSRGTEA